MKEAIFNFEAMDVWTNEKLRTAELLNYCKQQVEESNIYNNTQANGNINTNQSPSLYTQPDNRTALIPRAEQVNNDLNNDLEAGEGINNSKTHDPSSHPLNLGEGGEEGAETDAASLLYNDRFIQTVRSVAGLLDHTVYLCLRHFEPVTRSLALFIDALTALVHFLPDLCKDVMSFVNRLFDALLRFLSDFFAEAVPRTLESVTTSLLGQPISVLGASCGRGLTHLLTMMLSTLVKLVRMVLRYMVLGVGLLTGLGLVLWFTGGEEIVRALLVPAPGSGAGLGKE